MSKVGDKITEQKIITFHQQLIANLIGDTDATKLEYVWDEKVAKGSYYLTINLGRAILLIGPNSDITVELKLETIESEIFKALGTSYLEGLLENKNFSVIYIEMDNLRFQLKFKIRFRKDIESIIGRIIHDINLLKDKIFKEIADETLKARVVADKLKP